MKIVIDIPDRIHYAIEKDITVNGSKASQILIDAVKNGTPLPEGHGAEWINNKCSTCGKGIEDLIDSREWYENERPNYCPFCGKRFKESE